MESQKGKATKLCKEIKEKMSWVCLFSTLKPMQVNNYNENIHRKHINMCIIAIYTICDEWWKHQKQSMPRYVRNKLKKCRGYAYH